MGSQNLSTKTQITNIWAGKPCPYALKGNEMKTLKITIVLMTTFVLLGCGESEEEKPNAGNQVVEMMTLCSDVSNAWSCKDINWQNKMNGNAIYGDYEYNCNALEVINTPKMRSYPGAIREGRITAETADFEIRRELALLNDLTNFESRVTILRACGMLTEQQFRDIRAENNRRISEASRLERERRDAESHQRWLQTEEGKAHTVREQERLANSNIDKNEVLTPEIYNPIINGYIDGFVLEGVVLDPLVAHWLKDGEGTCNREPGSDGVARYVCSIHYENSQVFEIAFLTVNGKPHRELTIANANMSYKPIFASFDFTNGVLDGPYKITSLNGQTELFKGGFSGGVPSGDFYVNYDNGKRYMDFSYRSGKLYGLFTTYHSNSKIQHQVAYDGNGQKQDYERYYWNNGEIREIYLYHSGRKQGEYNMYDESGNLTQTGVCMNDVCEERQLTQAFTSTQQSVRGLIAVIYGEGGHTDVYNKPTASSEIEGRLSNGTEVKILEDLGMWYQVVSTNENRRLSGYIHKSQIYVK